MAADRAEAKRKQPAPWKTPRLRDHGMGNEPHGSMMEIVARIDPLLCCGFIPPGEHRRMSEAQSFVIRRIC